ncbi:MAG: serine/threonine-protein kinase [Planctomycetaceae bacterium]|nr:serine/threonine-protein kinase [Planctomycetaceae bacterium]
MIDVDERTRLWNLVEETIARWREGESPDAAGFLARHPEIGSRKTLALDLIHEELCLRKESGDTIVPSTFIERFPDYRSSIAKIIEVEQYGQQNPGFAEALGESMWPQVGQEYQGFEIVEPLGRGAVARVYLARETAMGRRPVVIKVSQHGGHEAHLLGKLEHPNVVAAHSVKHDEPSGMTVICMPLLGTATGLDLMDAAHRKGGPPVTAKIIGQVARQYQPAGLVKEESLSEAFPFARRTFVEGIVWLGKELATGLAAAGKLGVAHRDIKPSNVLLAWSGRPMLLDFNLSSGEDQAGDRVGGTLAYMAPERIELLLADRSAGDEKVDTRPDIFSLGVVLYELLAGRLPVQPMDAEGSDAPAMRRWLESRQQPIAPASQFNRSVDAEVDRVVLRCLAADPGRRYATAADLAGDLAAYLSPRQMAARWLRRNRRSVLAGSIAAGAALVAGGIYWSRLPPYHEVKYEEGMAQHEAGDYQAAIAAFTRSLERKPENPKAREARARSFYRLGLQRYDAADFQGAIVALNQSLEDHPTSIEALFARGQSFYRHNDLQAAQKDFVEAANIEPRAILWFCAGCCGLMDRSGFDYLFKARQAGYDEAAVYCNLGVCHVHGGARSRAIPNFDQAIKLKPELPEPRIERAQARMNAALQGDAESRRQAIEDIKEAERLGLTSRRLYFLGAQLHTLAIDQDSRAIEEADRLFRLMRSLDERQATYENDSVFKRLLSQRPKLAKVGPDPSFVFVPEGQWGIGPPATADLSLVPAP